MPEKELKTLVLVRVPPGDRWKEPGKDEIFPSLTEALNSVFNQTGVTEYFISAREGTVSMITTEDVPLPPPPPPKTFSIYGDE